LFCGGPSGKVARNAPRSRQLAVVEENIGGYNPILLQELGRIRAQPELFIFGKYLISGGDKKLKPKLRCFIGFGVYP
jgi:hypothetical protein